MQEQKNVGQTSNTLQERLLQSQYKQRHDYSTMLLETIITWL